MNEFEQMTTSVINNNSTLFIEYNLSKIYSTNSTHSIEFKLKIHKYNK